MGPEGSVAPPPEARPKAPRRPKPVSPVKPAEAGVSSVVQTEPQVSSKITTEARDLLSKLSQEGTVPAFITANFQRILQENGVAQEDINKMRPEEAADWLRNKAKAEDEQPESGTPAEPADATEPTDASVEKPVDNRQRLEDLRGASDVALTTRVRALNSELGRMTDEEYRSAVDENRGINVLLTLDDIRNGKEIQGKLEGVKTAEGVVVVTNIASGEESSAVCVIEGRAETMSISRGALVDAQLLSEADAMRSQFPDPTSPERIVLEARISVLQNGEEGLPTGDTPIGAAVDAAVGKVFDAESAVGMEAGLLEYHAGALEQKIQQLQKEKKPRSIEDERLLALLRLGQLARGEGAVFVRSRAITMLRERKVEIPEPVVAALNKQLGEARPALDTLLRSLKLKDGGKLTDEQIGKFKDIVNRIGIDHMLATGGLEPLLGEGGVAQVGEFIFGDTPDSDINAQLGNLLADKTLLEKYGGKAKKGGLLFLVMIALASGMVIKDAASTGRH